MALQLDFTARPRFVTVYRRAVLGRRPGMRPGDALPSIAATWRGARVDPTNLADYRAHCGITAEPGLPLHYPHVMISPVHLTMLTEPEYPLGLLGAVHLRNHAVRYRPLVEDDVLDLSAKVVGHRFRPQGVETDVDSWACGADGEVVWRERSTFLVRQKGLPEDPPSALADIFVWPEDAESEELDAFRIPPDGGRRYAKISGDYNPIHMSKWAAKVFGFKRDIVHGMWGLARATANVPELASGGPVRVDAAFKGPLFMGSRVAVRTTSVDHGRSLRVFVGDDPRPAIMVAVRAVGADNQPQDAP